MIEMAWKDPNKKKQYNAEYYQKNRKVIREQQRQYNIETNEKQTARKRKNYDPVKRKERTIKEKDHTSIIGKIWRDNNQEHIKQYQEEFEQTPHRKQYLRNYYLVNRKTYLERDRNRSRSHNVNYSIDLEIAMNNVRKRDKSTCQWQGCNLSFKDGFPIHVHHIFPRNEYAELELIEEYMICYCLNHHYMWHKYRGDRCASLLKPKDKPEIQGRINV